MKFWEVEQKFRLENLEPFWDRLNRLQATPAGTEDQVDTYLRHPSRDFRETDEALRIRTVNGNPLVTYKGPRLAGPVKIRPEIEIPLAPNTVESWLRIWEGLGFTIAAQVRKRRQLFEVQREQVPYTLAIDSVEGLGDFVEIERVIDDLSAREVAQTEIELLAVQLQLSLVEKRSYLSMILGAR